MSAMYLGHRQSDDLVLFTTNESIHPNEKEKITSVLRAVYVFDMPTLIHSTFASISINEVKVEFVADMFAYKGERPGIILDNVACKVDSWDNLCVAKFSAFLSRTSDKDISDVGAILDTAKDDFELKEMVNFLICETRKRDSMADELINIFNIASYATQMAKKPSYKTALSKLCRIIMEFKNDLNQSLCQ